MPNPTTARNTYDLPARLLIKVNEENSQVHERTTVHSVGNRWRGQRQ